MDAHSSEQLIVKEYPVALWVVGGLLMAGGVFGALQENGLVPGGIMVLVGGLMAGLPSIILLTVDRLKGTLTVRHQALYRTTVREYALRDIASVEVDSSRSSRGGHTYRLVLALVSGERVPLQGYYSSGYAGKESKARKLREFMGVAGEGRPASGLRAAAQLFQPAYQMAQEGVTDGVAWRLEVANTGAAPAARWVAPAAQWPGQFLCLIQKPKDAKAAGGGGLTGAVSLLLYRQVLALYGFAAEDLPGLETAGLMEALDPRLAAHFVALTTDPAGARQRLTPWVVMPLLQRVEQHPLPVVQRSGAGQTGQLVVLFSPRGVYVVDFNAAAPEQAEALARLGADLVRAQGAA